MTKNLIIDTSAWIHFFSKPTPHKKVVEALNGTQKIIIPTIIIYELTKKLLEKYNKNIVAEHLAALKKFEIINLDSEISILAGTLSRKHNLAMADSIILASAETLKCKIITFDQDFKTFKIATCLKNN